MCPRPNAVSMIRCVHDPLCLLPDLFTICHAVSTTRCVHDTLSRPRPMCPRPNAMSTTRCVHDTLSRPRPMCSRPNAVSTTRCVHDTLSRPRPMCPLLNATSTTRCVHDSMSPRPDVSTYTVPETSCTYIKCRIALRCAYVCVEEWEEGGCRPGVRRKSAGHGEMGLPELRDVISD